MHIQFFIPSIYQLPTGGNIFNRKIIDFLSDVHAVTVTVYRQSSDLKTGRVQADVSHKTHIVFVDSLLLREPSVRKFMKRKASGVRFVLLVHYLHLIDPEQENSPAAQQELELLSTFDGFVTTSGFSAEKLIRQGVRFSKVCVAQPGLDLIYRTEIRKNEPAPIPLLLTVSSILPGKGLPEFISILEKQADLDWQWQIVGEAGLDREFYRKFDRHLEGLRRAGRVVYHGSVVLSKLVRLYDEADLFVLPSHFESCSMVSMEAMSRGLPVLAYQVGGLQEIVINGQNGYLIPPGNVSEFSRSLWKLISDPGLRKQLGENALLSSREFPGWEDTGNTVNNFLMKISHF